MTVTMCAALGWSTGSSAQNSSTSYYRVGNTVQCNTTTQAPPPPIAPLVQPSPMPDFGNSFMQGYLQGQAIRRQREAAQQEQYARAQAEIAADKARFREGLRKDVGDLLAAGDCPKAIAVALKYGEIELANQAKAFCAKP